MPADILIKAPFDAAPMQAMVVDDGTGKARVVSDTSPLPVAVPSSTGSVRIASDAKLVKVTPSLDTAAYASGDVLFTSTEIAGALIQASTVALMAGIAGVDADDQGAALDLYFFSKSGVSMGARNAAATSISDADAAYFLGKVTIASGDWEDVGGARWFNAQFSPGKSIFANSEDVTLTTSIWVIGVTRGTPTHTASGLTLKFFVVR